MAQLQFSHGMINPTRRQTYILVIDKLLVVVASLSIMPILVLSASRLVPPQFPQLKWADPLITSSLRSDTTLSLVVSTRFLLLRPDLSLLSSAYLIIGGDNNAVNKRSESAERPQG